MAFVFAPVRRKLIYHICAGNLAVSAWTSIAHGLLLGAHNVVKLPGDRDDSTARREILGFIRGLPAPLRKLVETHRALDDKLLRRADAVVAFGSDATMASLRAQTRAGTRNSSRTATRSACSGSPTRPPHRAPGPRLRGRCADLRPTRLPLAAGDLFSAGNRFRCAGPEARRRAGDAMATSSSASPARPLSVAARIAEARDLAHALGHRVWLPPKKHLGWTLIHDPDPRFQPSPLHGVIYLRQARESRLRAALASVAGRISTVGVAGQISSRLENVFLSLGVSRFCAAGRMQFPPLTWHHDGRPPLADLVTWIDFEKPRDDHAPRHPDRSPLGRVGLLAADLLASLAPT